MIHISQSTKPPLASTMCTRRNKGIFQTSVILVLLVCIGYGFYLYSLLQQRVRYLDTKSINYHAQQQSLSSQLQVVYEDRARLEKAVQKSRNDLLQSKEDLKSVQRQKESELQELVLEHQDRQNELQESHDKLKMEHEDLRKERDELKVNHDSVLRHHEELKRKHEELTNNHDEELKKAQEIKMQFQKENENLRRLKDDLEYQVQEAQDGASRYTNLRFVLKAVPANAVNLDHPAIANLAENAKQMLFDHLGENVDDPNLPVQRQNLRQEEQQPDHEDVDERNQEQEEEQQQRRNDFAHVQNQLGNDVPSEQQSLLQPAQHVVDQEDPKEEEEDKQEEEEEEDLPQENIEQQRQDLENDPNMIDICSLPPNPGNCLGNENRFAYYPQFNQCRMILYSGCGGNQNNFKTGEECEEVCNDLSRRFIPKPFSEEQEIEAIRRQKEANQQLLDQDQQLPSHQTEAQDHEDNGNQDIYEEEDENPDEQEEDEEDDVRGDQDEYEEQQRVIHQEEERIRLEEEKARRELERQQKDDGGEEEGDVEDHIAQLKKLSEQQLQMAEDQKNNMQKYLEQQQNENQGLEVEDRQDQIDGVIQDEKLDQANDDDDVYRNEEEEEEEEEVEEEEGDEEENNEDSDEMGKDVRHQQVDLPPAVQVAGQDPEAVMNLPPRAAIAGEDPDDAINAPPHESREDREDFEDEQDEDPQIEDDNAVGHQVQLDYGDNNQEDNLDPDGGQQNEEEDYDDGDEQENEAVQRRRARNRLEQQRQDAEFRRQEGEHLFKNKPRREI